MNALSLITKGFTRRFISTKTLIVESINIALSVNQPKIEIDIEDINTDVSVSKLAIEMTIEDIETSIDIPELDINLS